MKKVLLILLIIPVCLASYAQEEPKQEQQMQTLLGDQVDHGGYGALMFNYSQINDKDAWLFGMRGGWMIDHVFTLGLGGYGFFNNASIDNLEDGDYDIAGGYGGLLLEATVLPSKAVHLAFPVLIGAGGVAALDSYWSYDWEDYYVASSDAFFVIEPGMELELNVVKFMRIGLAVTYRYCRDVDMVGLPSDGLNGFNFGGTMKFGKF